MKYLKNFDSLNETLKSYEIDIISRRIRSFFNKLGIKEKGILEFDFMLPEGYVYYSITSDRDFMRREIERLKNPSKESIKLYKKHGYDISIFSKMLKDQEEDLKSFKYGDIFIYLKNGNTPEITKDLLNIVYSSGYYISSLGMSGEKVDKSKAKEYLSNNKSIGFSIEPNHDPVKFDGEYLYHTTNKNALNKILSKGLIPKTKNTRSFYPERIHLSPNEEYNQCIKTQLEHDKKGEYVTLKIKNFPGLKLHKDVRFKGGFFTYNNIPPKYISIDD